MKYPLHTTALSNEEYHALLTTDRIYSKTSLDTFADCPARLKAVLDGLEREESDSMRLGTLAHIALLEPHAWDRSVVVLPEDAPKDLRHHRDAKKPSEATLAAIKWWDDFEAEAASRRIITPAERDAAQGMAKAVLFKLDRIAAIHGGINPFSHPDGVFESSLFWIDENTGVKCRCRPDWMLHGGKDGPNFIIDLKSTQSSRPQAFDKSTENYRYDVSAAFYSDGFKAVFGVEPDAYLLVCPEKKAPHITTVRIATPEIIRRGREAYKADLAGIAKCERTGEWPDYGDDFIPMALPSWAKESRVGA